MQKIFAPLAVRPAAALRRLALSLSLFAAFAPMACHADAPAASVDTALARQATQAGATEVTASRRSDGGLLLNGKLEGNQFAVAIPPKWNKQAVLFAHGYSAPGTPVKVSEDPIVKDTLGPLRIPYEQGFAAGHSAYAKAGVGVETGVESTYRLQQLLTRLGATRSYIIGASMGGDITVALLEKYPRAFAGGIAGCGLVGGWIEEIALLTDVRASYEYFTRGTAYALPGEKNLAKSAISPVAADGSLIPTAVPQIAAPVVKLFAAAAANPKGPEQRIIDNVVAVTGVERDPAAFAMPIILIGLGVDDMNQTWGGPIYDNHAKVYHSGKLSAAENAALNAGIERVRANPQAVARAKAWYTPTGRFDAKLITLYNAIDPLVPSTLEEPALRRAVERAGNGKNLVQRSVPPLRKELLPGSKIEGYAHCGFNTAQVDAAWKDLRNWVETGKKPEQAARP